MKKYSFLFFILMITGNAQVIYAQNIAINANGAAPDSSAMLDVQSTSKGMLIPRLTSAQIAAIPSPALGLLVFNTTTGTFNYRLRFGWAALSTNFDITWLENYPNVYLNNGEKVGIGTSTPGVPLQVDKGTDVTDTSGGYLQLGSSVNPNLAFDNNEIQARDNGHFADLSLQAGGGNVGIGTKKPEVRLQISNGTDASTVGGYLQLGAGTLQNLGFDNNEIQSRNNGNVSKLYLQNSGGDINVGSNAIGVTESNLNIANGKLTKANTGSYNMMPLCYGRVSDAGTLVSGTPNVTAVRVGKGHYHINCADINSSAITMATPMEIAGSGTGHVVVLGIKQGQADIYFYYANDAGDGAFSFIFYNP